MKSEKPEKPLILVVDPSPTFPLILKAILRRACEEVEIVSFQKPDQAIFWLSGAMDHSKAVKYPFLSPWDAYPPLRTPTIAIVSLSYSPDDLDCNERLMDRLYCLSRSRGPKIITTSTRDTLLALDNRWDEVYWRKVVSHLPRPVRVDDLIERVFPALIGEQ